ncbi:unnamed protein product [Bursaphelenchus xylophilus]|uniref:(pine wood nematode) hypothetical protein n=1 Tax=Bursaphelenchus xylophilus TaxID=6326 RepID=A0A7I8X9Y4_BURXY|nr:unnamed protein product [Bursaphelenchus xylophilus]CAG9132199.1 unnamed protein product [Bursaphelenchus xylophilus]
MEYGVEEKAWSVVCFNLDHHLENNMNSNPDAARRLHSFHEDSQKHLTRLFLELMSKSERRIPLDLQESRPTPLPCPPA